MAVEESAVEVTVEVPVVEEDSAPDTVVIVTPPEDATEDDAVEAVAVTTLIDLAGRVALLEERLSGVQLEAMQAKWTAEDALYVAQEAETEEEEEAEETAIEEEIEATEEAEEDAEPDAIAPASTKVHPLFRSKNDWFK